MKYLIRGTLTIEASTIVEAESGVEAKQAAINRSVGTDKYSSWVKNHDAELELEYIEEVEQLS